MAKYSKCGVNFINSIYTYCEYWVPIQITFSKSNRGNSYMFSNDAKFLDRTVQTKDQILVKVFLACNPSAYLQSIHNY